MTVFPFTCTRPSRMICSQARRLSMPAAARIFCRRSWPGPPGRGPVFLGAAGVVGLGFAGAAGEVREELRPSGLRTDRSSEGVAGRRGGRTTGAAAARRTGRSSDPAAGRRGGRPSREEAGRRAGRSSTRARGRRTGRSSEGVPERRTGLSSEAAAVRRVGRSSFRDTARFVPRLAEVLALAGAVPDPFGVNFLMAAPSASPDAERSVYQGASPNQG